jgi:hypothetical protein
MALKTVDSPTLKRGLIYLSICHQGSRQVPEKAIANFKSHAIFMLMPEWDYKGITSLINETLYYFGCAPFR